MKFDLAPYAFDGNEWFILGAMAISGLAAYLLPRRFPTSLTLLIFLWAGAVSRITDHLLAGPAHKDLYDIMDINKIEYFDLLTYVFYGPFAYLKLYLYDVLKPRGLWITCFLVGTAIMASLVEWVAVKCGVFTYKQWHVVISFSVYLLVQSITIWMFHFLKSKHGRINSVGQMEEKESTS